MKRTLLAILFVAILVGMSGMRWTQAQDPQAHGGVCSTTLEEKDGRYHYEMSAEPGVTPPHSQLHLRIYSEEDPLNWYLDTTYFRGGGTGAQGGSISGSVPVCPNDQYGDHIILEQQLIEPDPDAGGRGVLGGPVWSFRTEILKRSSMGGGYGLGARFEYAAESLPLDVDAGHQLTTQWETDQPMAQYAIKGAVWRRDGTWEGMLLRGPYDLEGATHGVITVNEDGSDAGLLNGCSHVWVEISNYFGDTANAFVRLAQ